MDKGERAAERRGHGRTAEGGVEIGRRVRLPRGATDPIRVYVNGVEQQRGGDYELRGGEVVFAEPIVKEGRLGGLRWLSLWIGLAGTYRRNETVDIEYTLGGRTHLLSDAEVLPDR